jgi:hypothetical protein
MDPPDHARSMARTSVRDLARTSVRELERTAGLRPHTVRLFAEAATLRPDDMQAVLENSTTNWLARVQRQVVRTTDGKQEVEHLVGQYHILLQTAEDLRSITFSPVGAPAAAEPVCTVRAVKRGAMFRGMGDPHVGDYVFACTKGSNCVAFTPSDLFTMKASAIQNRLPIRLTLVRREAVTLGTLRDGGAVAVAIDIMEEEEMWAAELVEAEEKRRAYLREQRKAREAAKAARDTNAAASGPDPCCEDEG